LQVFSSRGIGSIKSFSQELRMAGEAGEAVRWLLGANYQHDDVKDSSAPFVRDSSFPFRSADAVANNVVDTYAAFANMDWEVVPSLTLTAGLRYSWQDRAFNGCLYDTGDNSLAPLLAGVSTRLSGTPTSIPPGGCVTLNSMTFKPAVVVDSLNEGSVSWKAGLNWQVDPRKLLYVLVSKGYKNGVFITTGATFDLSLAPATQESVIAYEAGFKLGLLGRTLQLNGASFYYDYKDKQIRGRIIDPVVGPFNRILNVPASRAAGAELQISWEPTTGLTFNGGATYIDTKILGNFVNFTPSLRQKLLSGEPFPLTPKWQVTGDVLYDFPVNDHVNLFAGANATYQDKTNAALGQEALFDIEEYAVVDLRVGVRDKDDAWRVTAFAQNVGNTYYWTNVAAPSPDIAYRLAGRPRTYGVTARFRFQ
jgi:outer membrane receptor protein involved in Fe transport